MANLPTNTTLSPKINEVEKKISNITNLATTSSFTTIENDVRDHSKNITTPEFNKLTAETFTARFSNYWWYCWSQKKTDFDDKQNIFNKKVTSNKSKYLLAENELRRLRDKIEKLKIYYLGPFIDQSYFFNDGTQRNFSTTSIYFKQARWYWQNCIKEI